MSDNDVLFVYLGIVIIIGVVLPLCISPFVDISKVNADSKLSTMISVLTDGLNINLPDINLFLFKIPLPDFHIPLISIFPEPVETYINNYFNTFSYIPDILAIPLMLILFFCTIFMLIKFIPFL